MSFWCDIDRRWRSHPNLRTLYLLLLGQMVSLVLAMGSFTSSLVSSLGVDAPITQSSFNYLALALVYGSILLYKRQNLQISWYWYLLLGLVDVQGNYLEHSTRLHGAFFKYLKIQYIVSMCSSLVEVVSMLGLWIPVELKTLEAVVWSKDIVFAIAGYTVSMFLFYSLAPIVLKLSGAMMFNLSILTADIWAVVFRVFFYHQQVDWLYFLSFAIVASGLIIYSITEEDRHCVEAPQDGNSNPEYQELLENAEEIL